MANMVENMRQMQERLKHVEGDRNTNFEMLTYEIQKEKTV